LLLTPGISQVYYGDESARSLDIPGTEGDATLRSFMNWDAVANDAKTKDILAHWQKLGMFRKNHPAVGAGVHKMITASPYVFERTFVRGTFTDVVIIGLELPTGPKTVRVGGRFKDGSKVRDTYSGQEAVVKDGGVTIDSEYTLLLLEAK